MATTEGCDAPTQKQKCNAETTVQFTEKYHAALLLCTFNDSNDKWYSKLQLIMAAKNAIRHV